jgi:uncharacterized protein (TIGR02001 family)
MKLNRFAPGLITRFNCVSGCPLVATAAHAELTANLALTSDYIFRGISNSNRKPALQGGIDYAHASGWYAGGWASSVDFNDGGEARVEVDGYLGHAGSAGKLSWNVGWLAYVYPGASQSLQYDSQKLLTGVQYDLTVAVIGLYIDRVRNVFGSGPATYLETSLVVPLRADVSLDMRLGRQRYTDNAYLSLPDFTYRNLSLVWQSSPWETRLAWQNNGVAVADCLSGKSWCGPAWLLQVTRHFALG